MRGSRPRGCVPLRVSVQCSALGVVCGGEMRVFGSKTGGAGATRQSRSINAQIEASSCAHDLNLRGARDRQAPPPAAAAVPTTGHEVAVTDVAVDGPEEGSA